MRRFPSFSFLLAGALLAVGSPMPRAQEQQADPKARELLREVYAKRETWGPAFPGFQARLVVGRGGREHRGTARVGADYRVEVQLPDAEAAAWARDELQSMAAHRRQVPFEEGDGRYPLTFGPQDTHPAGRLIRLNDRGNGSYRVRDGQILQINRSAGPLRFTIDILENLSTDSGRVLPRVFTVSYFRAQNGELEKTETFWDTYRKTGEYWLPEGRRKLTAEDGGTETSFLRLEEVKLL